jgi:hypothetical protein
MAGFSPNSHWFENRKPMNTQNHTHHIQKRTPSTRTDQDDIVQKSSDFVDFTGMSSLDQWVFVF